MPEFGVQILDHDVKNLRNKFINFRNSFDPQHDKLQQEMADLLIVEIEIRAPKATNAYSRSYQKRYMGRVKGWRVFTDAPQARRLEYGFIGTDSLGRNYNQEPRPHVRPAARAVAAVYATRYSKMFGDTWRAAR